MPELLENHLPPPPPLGINNEQSLSILSLFQYVSRTTQTLLKKQAIGQQPVTCQKN